MRSLQYCCLLIPVKNRELMQMLLKFMIKLMDNHVISLSDELPTKEMVSREWFINNITNRRYYMVVRRYEFYVRVARTISHK